MTLHVQGLGLKKNPYEAIDNVKLNNSLAKLANSRYCYVNLETKEVESSHVFRRAYEWIKGFFGGNDLGNQKLAAFYLMRQVNLMVEAAPLQEETLNSIKTITQNLNIFPKNPVSAEKNQENSLVENASITRFFEMIFKNTPEEKSEIKKDMQAYYALNKSELGKYVDAHEINDFFTENVFQPSGKENYSSLQTRVKLPVSSSVRIETNYQEEVDESLGDSFQKLFEPPEQKDLKKENHQPQIASPALPFVETVIKETNHTEEAEKSLDDQQLFEQPEQEEPKKEENSQSSIASPASLRESTQENHQPQITPTTPPLMQREANLQQAKAKHEEEIDETLGDSFQKLFGRAEQEEPNKEENPQPQIIPATIPAIPPHVQTQPTEANRPEETEKSPEDQQLSGEPEQENHLPQDKEIASSNSIETKLEEDIDESLGESFQKLFEKSEEELQAQDKPIYAKLPIANHVEEPPPSSMKPWIGLAAAAIGGIALARFAGTPPEGLISQGQALTQTGSVLTRPPLVPGGLGSPVVTTVLPPSTLLEKRFVLFFDRKKDLKIASDLSNMRSEQKEQHKQQPRVDRTDRTKPKWVHDPTVEKRSNFGGLLRDSKEPVINTSDSKEPVITTSKSYNYASEVASFIGGLTLTTFAVIQSFFAKTEDTPSLGDGHDIAKLDQELELPNEDINEDINDEQQQQPPQVPPLPENLNKNLPPAAKPKNTPVKPFKPENSISTFNAPPESISSASSQLQQSLPAKNLDENLTLLPPAAKPKNTPVKPIGSSSISAVKTSTENATPETTSIFSSELPQPAALDLKIYLLEKEIAWQTEIIYRRTEFLEALPNKIEKAKEEIKDSQNNLKAKIAAEKRLESLEAQDISKQEEKQYSYHKQLKNPKLSESDKQQILRRIEDIEKKIALFRKNSPEYLSAELELKNMELASAKEIRNKQHLSVQVQNELNEIQKKIENYPKETHKLENEVKAERSSFAAILEKQRQEIAQDQAIVESFKTTIPENEAKKQLAEKELKEQTAKLEKLENVYIKLVENQKSNSGQSNEIDQNNSKRKKVSSLISKAKRKNDSLKKMINNQKLREKSLPDEIKKQQEKLIEDEKSEEQNLQQLIADRKKETSESLVKSIQNSLDSILIQNRKIYSPTSTHFKNLQNDEDALKQQILNNEEQMSSLHAELEKFEEFSSLAEQVQQLKSTETTLHISDEDEFNSDEELSILSGPSSNTHRVPRNKPGYKNNLEHLLGMYDSEPSSTKNPELSSSEKLDEPRSLTPGERATSKIALKKQQQTLLKAIKKLKTQIADTANTDPIKAEKLEKILKEKETKAFQISLEFNMDKIFTEDSPISPFLNPIITTEVLSVDTFIEEQDVQHGIKAKYTELRSSISNQLVAADPSETTSIIEANKEQSVVYTSEMLQLDELLTRCYNPENHTFGKYIGINRYPEKEAEKLFKKSGETSILSLDPLTNWLIHTKTNEHITVSNLLTEEESSTLLENIFNADFEFRAKGVAQAQVLRELGYECVGVLTAEVIANYLKTDNDVILWIDAKGEPGKCKLSYLNEDSVENLSFAMDDPNSMDELKSEYKSLKDNNYNFITFISTQKQELLEPVNKLLSQEHPIYYGIIDEEKAHSLLESGGPDAAIAWLSEKEQKLKISCFNVKGSIHEFSFTLKHVGMWNKKITALLDNKEFISPPKVHTSEAEEAKNRLNISLKSLSEHYAGFSNSIEVETILNDKGNLTACAWASADAGTLMISNKDSNGTIIHEEFELEIENHGAWPSRIKAIARSGYKFIDGSEFGPTKTQVEVLEAYKVLELEYGVTDLLKIDHAYRRKAKTVHPDRHPKLEGESDETFKARTTDKMDLFNESRTIIEKFISENKK